jgi:ribosomal protein L6P/L9E
MKDYGWKEDKESKIEHDWSTLKDNIQNHIKGVNFGYKSKMKDIGAHYINAYASFLDPTTVKFLYGPD